MNALEATLWATSNAIATGTAIESIDFYVNGDGSKLSAARELALRVLIVPAGETSSERVFLVRVGSMPRDVALRHVLQNKQCMKLIFARYSKDSGIPVGIPESVLLEIPEYGILIFYVFGQH